MKILVSISCVFLSAFAFSQEDTLRAVLDLNYVVVRPMFVLTPANPVESQSIGRATIEQLQPEDVGQLLQKFAGVSLKSYGGLGGLKTFSFRSLGSQHTATNVNGFTLVNAQTGQLNLGQIQTSNIESISLGNQSNHVSTPVSALVMANQLSMTTFEGIPYWNRTKIRASTKLGSFGQTDSYVSYHLSKKKFGFTVFGKYRQAEGDYPYSLRVGNYVYEGKQANNALQEVYSGVSLFFRPNQMKQPIRLMYKNALIDQELPGAVVLYSTKNKQYLTTDQHIISLDWKDKWNLIDVRYYANYQYDESRYLDSGYLNKQGYLKRNFFQNNASAGIRINRSKFGQLINFYAGLEQNYAQLNMVSPDGVLPQRYTTFSTAGLNIEEVHYSIDMRLSHQLVLEHKQEGSELDNRSLFSPYVSFLLRERGKYRWSLGFKTSTTSRLPSFNELYFGQVGNQDLEPEKVRQFVLSNAFARYKNKWEWRTRLSVYYNIISNKIIAIPTKNLFVWSIQNIGLVHASGFDFNQVLSKKIGGCWSAELEMNYSYQRSINQTEDDINKGSQIAYIPVHTANADLTIKRKTLGVRMSNSYVGERYSLNENIPNNLMESFVNMDVSLFYAHKLKSKHLLTLQFQVKNIMDQNYTYVRSFVMPGRNYLITLSYALD